MCARLTGSSREERSGRPPGGPGAVQSRLPGQAIADPADMRQATSNARNIRSIPVTAAPARRVRPRRTRRWPGATIPTAVLPERRAKWLNDTNVLHLKEAQQVLGEPQAGMNFISCCRLNDNLIIFTFNILKFGQLELLDMPQY